LSVDPEAILEYWFGDCARDPARAEARESFWFGGSDAADAEVRERFGDAIESTRGELALGRRAALGVALVVLLDQFPRNVWRQRARVQRDRQAPKRRAARSRRATSQLADQQAFLILPFQHCEEIDAQRGSVSLGADRAQRSGRLASLLDYYTDFAPAPRADRALRALPASPASTAATAEERVYLVRGRRSARASRSALRAAIVVGCRACGGSRAPDLLRPRRLIWLPYGICFFAPGYLAQIAGVAATTTATSSCRRCTSCKPESARSRSLRRYGRRSAGVDRVLLSLPGSRWRGCSRRSARGILLVQ
jgi:uncharacterized protein (DUF924 family)